MSAAAPRLLCWGTVEGVGLVELAAAAAAAGFPTISITPAMGVDALEALGEQEIRTRLAHLDVSIGMVDPLMRGLPGAPEPDSVARRFRSTFVHGEDTCWRLCDTFAIPMLNVAHYMGAPTPVSALADHVGGVAERAAAHGIGLTVEFMPEGSIPDLATAAAIVAAVDHPGVGIMLDTWHLHRTSGTAASVRALPSGAVHAVQLSDALDDVWGTGTEPPTRDRLLPGRGVIALGEIVGVVLGARPEAVVSIEVFDQTVAGDPPRDRARAAAAAMDAVL